MVRLLSAYLFIALVLFTAIFGSAVSCNKQVTPSASASVPHAVSMSVPHEGVWGLYELDLSSLAVKLIYNTSDEIFTSALRLNNTGDRLVFGQKVGGSADTDFEIFSIKIDGSGLSRITSNNYWDLYPVWSPDGGSVAFLSRRDKDLDIYLMSADGTNEKRLFDSGDNDADIDWAGDSIVFTSRSAVWKINEDGTSPVQLTYPPGLGEWGKANLPKGDYDPRLSKDGKYVVFARLEDAETLHGGYNFFKINIDGTAEVRLTYNSYSQSLASWSHSAEKIVYVVAAIEGVGKYDIYMMNQDGTGNHNITPAYFPPDFLCFSPVFSKDDTKIFFIGRWWE